MEKIAVSEFKAHCLKLFTRIKKTGMPMMITRNGEPLAVIHPAHAEEERAAFGAMRGTVHFDSETDPRDPLPAELWEVLK